MMAACWVASFVAPGVSVFTDLQVEAFVRKIAVAGRMVTEIVRLDGGRAVDVFFAGEAEILVVEGADVFVQRTATRCKKLLIADMESTIIEQEMLDELAAKIGIGEQVASITRRAMNGELDFEAALRERVGLLKGQPESLLHEVAACMTLSAGAQDLVLAMKRVGGRAWLVSGGFTFFIKKIAEQVGFDRFFGNELIVDA